MIFLLRVPLHEILHHSPVNWDCVCPPFLQNPSGQCCCWFLKQSLCLNCDVRRAYVLLWYSVLSCCESLGPCDSCQQWRGAGGSGAVLACFQLWWKYFLFPWSLALGFRLKYVFLVTLGTLFCLLHRVFKDGEGTWDFITCYVVPVVIPAVQGSWRAAWSSACRVSWRSVEGWVRVSREGGGWRHHLLLLWWDWQKQGTGRSFLSSACQPDFNALPDTWEAA